MKPLLDKVSMFWGWIIQGVPGDLRAAAVGSLAGLAATWLWNWYFAPGPPFEVEIKTEQGFASPFGPLLGAAAADQMLTAFTFDPPEFKKAWVCEYSHLTGYSGRQMMLDYLSKYSMCFAVVQSAEGAYTIRPNPNPSAEFRSTPEGWFCRCK